MKKFNGTCHCGKIKFSAILSLDHVRVCDCSICSMRGALNIRVARTDFKLHTPWEELSMYEWGSKTAQDYFCSVCGILPFRRPGDLTAQEIRDGKQPFDGYAVNTRCLQGVDFKKLPKKYIKGSELEYV